MSDYKFFRNLSAGEESSFRQWARDNYAMGDSIPSTWHPVIVDECMSMMTELAKKEAANGGDKEGSS